ncbi:hypothetical protein HII36_45115 [Nonomuraea sp. NN258]|uniref:hypothetical protein n=1 Tax=Nonomuraea antri TaxID=2730852 RepID=UPI0015691053|nr:hypothetical protein [Nonomuraea antri]NRQ38954.1 hypothetical protein [Nonomuraea antri]
MVIDELQLAIDEAYQGKDRTGVREVYSAASGHVALPADLLAHLNEVPEGVYTKREMAEAINEVIRGRGEEGTVGLLEIPEQVRPVEETIEAERAVQDETPLEFLNPTPTRPDVNRPDGDA